ncbi:MAG: MarR family winged helix-turn-helix transcriptional regulator [Planctomycetota bacterium]|nr:MarR family winged helix-turn-helix transcriptional regulator [Planctomycetota bacterium]
MEPQVTPPRQQVLDLAAAWQRLERRLDSNLSSVRGVSFAEYRMLVALADSPSATASRVDLATKLGVTPSGVTRALRPLEKLHVVETQRSERDARLALASLTDAGKELVDDCSGVVDDVLAGLYERSRAADPSLADVLAELAEQ